MDDSEHAAIDSELGVRGDEALSEDTRQKLQDLIERSRREYESSGMKRYALQAVRLAASLGEPAPEWTISPVEAYRLEARGVIERCAKEYFWTQNPMYAVQAYLEARSAGEPLPNWFLKYLDYGMMCFWDAFQTFIDAPAEERQLRNQPSKAFTHAFGISRPKIGPLTGKGRGTVWSRFDDLRWLTIGEMVVQIGARWVKDGHPIKQIEAVKEAVELYNLRRPSAQISFAAAWRDWTRYKRRYRRRSPSCVSKSRLLSETETCRAPCRFVNNAEPS
jgi:hypothetical protein